MRLSTTKPTKKMQITKLLSVAAITFVLVGCAHPLTINPDVSKIGLSTTDQPIKKNVAYYIPDTMRSKEVTTPGGGGDKVTYSPYRDIEVGFYKMLSNTFSSVTKLSTKNDKDAIEKNKIDYVITPDLLTNSSSSSALTWPPTQFSVDMTCDINDASGNLLFSKKVAGEGHAEYDEFKKDFSLAGKRATEDVLVKMQRTLLDTQELRQ
ncbi:putative lipoprotein [Collimonas fungivorans]|uniref:Putative lipoprotein n=1 Tax=Collimonas fungivorans TaxID=158899 RepID=A0A127PD08_9BURK|nr:hypothetical protein [Collimonas fungivorans]AMO95555.1 putative lipoprotein [Collimonas fungivorans]